MKPTRRLLFALAALALCAGSALAQPAAAPAPSAADPNAVQAAGFHGGGGHGRTLFLRFHNTLRCHSRVRVSFSEHGDRSYSLGPGDDSEFSVDNWGDDSAITGVHVDTFGCTGTIRDGTTCSSWLGRWTSRIHRHIRFEIFSSGGGSSCGVSLGRSWE